MKNSNKFGLIKEELSVIKLILSKSLLSKTHKSVYVFGSRVTNNYKKYSDFDLWIEATPNSTDSELLDLYEAFYESDLAIKVDIVLPEKCLEHYKAKINLQKVLWF